MTPRLLEKGDTIVIIAPAKCIDPKLVDFAVETLEKNGFKVEVSQHCKGAFNYFSGTVEERREDLQWAINHPTAKAILCARGGYGSVQIIDTVDWTHFLANPKWIIGFSDITVFHQFLAKHEISSLHATVPLNFMDNSAESLLSLFYSLQNGIQNYSWVTDKKTINGKSQGKLIGGNLAVLTSLVGTSLMPDYTEKILFIEDIGEALYAVDRYLQQLKKAGIFDKISGVIVGDFSSMRDSEPPYGQTLEEIILTHFENREIPIASDFPAGHCDDNRAVILGEEVEFVVEDGMCLIQSC